LPAKKLSRKYYTVADYHRLYVSGELTPTAVAKAILPLIRKDTSPPGEHSIAFFDSKVDLVLAAAEASTLRYKEKRPLGPLDGVPTAIKDEYDIEGYITCLGSKNDYTGKSKDGAPITSWCVKKLEEAGAVNVGKLHMHEFGLGTSLIPLFGRPTEKSRYFRQQPLQRYTAKSIQPSVLHRRLLQRLRLCSQRRSCPNSPWR
jgi:Asp-tRNA(Asn)/Glu-tRNA(Gln) amidotransferase A subunit family amidase